MKIYTTLQGDTWDAIAHRELGGTEHTGALMAANRRHRGALFFPAGVKLVLPDKPAETRTDITIPPWKRK